MLKLRSFKRRIFIYVFSLCGVASPFSVKASDSPASVGRLFAEKRWDEALKVLDQERVRQPAGESDFYHLSRALVFAQKAEWKNVLESLAAFKDKNGIWVDYCNLLGAQAQYNLGQLPAARAQAELVKTGATSRKLYNDAQMLLGRIALQEGRFHQARPLFVGLEKRLRREADYPEVLWNLGLSERGMGKNREFCARMTKLYRDYPSWPELKDWGPFLDENKVTGKESLCSFGWDDLLGRNRNLMLSGYTDRASAEIKKIETRSQGQKNFEVDRLRAQFYLQDGEVTHALELLAPYYKERKSDLSYLGVVASAAARAGDSSTAIGTYLNIHRLSPKSQVARNALFQAAFMSYQYQDYDGASQRFRQFLAENKKSGLALDAEWHLSWIDYLKGNYAKSYEGLAALKGKLRSMRHRPRNQTVDRVEYWMAMSQLKMKNLDQARVLFQDVAGEGGQSYYGLAARARLKQLGQGPSLAAQKGRRWIASIGGLPRSTYSSRAVLMAFDDGQIWARPLPDNTENFEETVSLNPLATSDEEVSANEEGIAEITDQKNIEIDGDGGLSTSTNPLVAQHFERARRLISLGLSDLAKWELYEIERKTANRDYLRALIVEYQRIDQFHRSSTIATHRFADARMGAIDQQKVLWESAYPRAFEKIVGDSSQKFSVPKEMIWAIMRAESSFKKEAVSPVGALGLMQVMPKTGEKLAELMSEKNFESQSLLQPENAIRMGTRYLQRLSRGFESDRALMAAAYNAGPHRVKTWLNRFGSLDLDEFIEHIPFLETRNYVKKVVANYQVYSQLYSDKGDVFPELTQPVSVRILEPVPMKETWEDI